MTPIIGAIMSEPLWHAFHPTLGDLRCEGLWLGPVVEGAHRELNGRRVDGIVVELSEECAGGIDVGVLFSPLPLASLPASPGYQELLVHPEGVTSIGSPDELEQWVETLAQEDEAASPVEEGKIFAVWGPPGSPGRTTLAVTLAGELSLTHQAVVVIDADPIAPSIALLLGLEGGESGLVRALRAARIDSPEVAALLHGAVEYRGSRTRFQVLSGSVSLEGDADFGSLAWGRVLTTLKKAGYKVVVDVGPGFGPGSGRDDTATELLRRAVITAVECADHLWIISHSSSLGVSRCVRGWSALSEHLTPSSVSVMLRGRQKDTGGNQASAREALWSYTGWEDITPLVSDHVLVAQVQERGETLADIPQRSHLRDALGPAIRSFGPRVPASPRSGGPTPKTRPRVRRALSALWSPREGFTLKR